MFLVLLGPPASGKGTQAEKICEHYNIPHIATGEMLRASIAKSTPLGMIAAQYINDGNFVPDDVMIKIVKERLNKDDAKNGYLLDGFPRTIAQADTLENFRKTDCVIALYADENELISRIASRKTCAECGRVYNDGFDRCGCGGELYLRKDDNKETFKQRLKVYNEQTKPLMLYYGQQSKLLEIDSNSDIETVFNSIKDGLKDAGYDKR